VRLNVRIPPTQLLAFFVQTVHEAFAFMRVLMHPVGSGFFNLLDNGLDCLSGFPKPTTIR